VKYVVSFDASSSSSPLSVACAINMAARRTEVEHRRPRSLLFCIFVHFRPSSLSVLLFVPEHPDQRGVLRELQGLWRNLKKKN
jgi:hypothetical protein